MRLLVPQSPLDRFVEVIWLLPRGTEPQHELALPTGTVELVIDLDDDTIAVAPLGGAGVGTGSQFEFQGAVICGAHSRPFVIEDHEGCGRTLGVHFKPGGAAVLLPVPIFELDDQRVALEELLGAQARRLRDLLDPSLTENALLTLVQDFLIERISTDLHPVVCGALTLLQADREIPPSVGALVEQSGYSHRRFNELFRKTVGLGTKSFSRVMRFQRALRAIETGREFDWADMALACGFHDQAHMIHEFQRHGAMTPMEYLARRGDRFNHPRAC